MIKRLLYILLTAAAITSCTSYSKIMKNADEQYKFAKAKEFYQNEKWLSCAHICESLMQGFRGTPDAEEALYYIYMSYINNEDYQIARTYLKSYIKSYPRGEHNENARFNLAYCYYHESPEVSLDQEPTKAAIEEIDNYLMLFPNGENAGLAKEMKIEMEEKLAEKELNTVKLYYNLGDYQGNNYLSAQIVARNAKRQYPQSRHCEELSYYILKAAYQQAVESVERKQHERYIDAIDEYYAFAKEYPESKFKKEADEMYEKSQKYLKRHKAE